MRPLLAVLGGLLGTFYGGSHARAVPSFARKYQTSCITCHTVFPALNPFGEAFRRDGFRFPSTDGSVDSDNVRAQMLALGQEQYKDLFPEAVWPAAIPSAVPLSLVVNGGAAANLPDSEARRTAGHTWAWNDLVEEVALFGAGAFDDSLSYFVEATVSPDEGADIEHAYLVWSDLGAPHAINLAIGRLAPTLTSFGLHGSFLSDTLLPAPAIGPLYNPDASGGSIATASGHPDGLEFNGVLSHRLDYSVGWVASGAADSLKVPDSQDLYAHVGAKLGGMSLDGEGPGGALVSDPMRPWAETAVTLDVFGYHGLERSDNGSLADAPAPQDDHVNALGGTIRLSLQSFVATLGLWVEAHSAPYAALPAAQGGAAGDSVDRHSAVGIVAFDELAYVVYPWLVPVIRGELTRISLDAANGGGSANVVRVLPGVAVLLRPNLKLTLAAELERAYGAPPAMTWEPSGASIAAQAPGQTETEPERIKATLLWGF